MIDLSLNKLKLIAKNRGIKDYKNKSEDDLIKILSEPKAKISLSKKTSRKKCNNQDKFIRPKINKIRRSLYDIKTQKIFLDKKLKRLKKIFLN